MKYYLSKNRKQAGFSLIELMVVVVIIGLLAALAIPQYGKFQKKAMQQEAKVGLSGLYTAMQAFITEWRFGTTDMEQLGFRLSGNSPVYSVGFADRGTNARDAASAVSETTRNGYRGPLAPAAANKVPHSGADWPNSIANNSVVFGSTAPNCQNNSGNTACDTNGPGNTVPVGCSWDSTSTTCIGTNQGGLSVAPIGSNIAFIAGATGYLGVNVPGETDHDSWIIDNNKNMQNSNEGIDK